MLATIIKGCGALTVMMTLAASACACPFCESATPSWLTQIREADIAVIAKVTAVKPAAANAPIPLVEVQLEVLQSLAEAAPRAEPKSFRCELLETPQVGSQWLFSGAGEPERNWQPVSALTDARARYLQAALQLPREGNARWQFFYAYLENADEALATDAYGEFAIAPFAAVQAFQPHLKRAQLWQWIRSEKTPEQRRGLYYTMLGLCGTPADAQELELLLTTPEKRPPGGFDALVACYLTLRADAGLKVVEAQLLASPKTSEADLQAVLLALRFHGEEQHVLKRARIAKALRLVLDRPQLAAVVIPDLARWQDWDSLDALVALFKQCDRDNAWLRIPIVSYLRACPLPAAKQQLVELAKIDPEAVEQADSLSLFGVKLRGSSEKK
ncbi:MAG TPA: hypothetical protein VL096_15940 [Pirellulaceae bacterium]|nr:hypothetical protein [Pirellulaceae bacterium]